MLNRTASPVARAVMETLESRRMLSASVPPEAPDSDLAYDVTGKLHVAYRDERAKDVRYAARSTTGKWSKPIVVDADSPDTGAHVSLALGRGGMPAMAYYDAHNGDLKYARWTGGAWDIQTVDTKGAVGLYPSLAIGRDGDPVIAYYDATRDDLRVARQGGSGWDVTVVDAAGDVGRHASVAVDPGSGRWRVAYEATGAGELRSARQTDDGAPEVSVIDARALGGSVSLGYDGKTFDGRGDATVAYHDARTGTLRLAKEAGEGWSIQTVAKGRAGEGARLGFDKVGKPRVAFWDGRRGKLRVAERTADKKWAFSTLLKGEGRGAAVAFAKDGTTGVVHAAGLDGARPVVGERFAPTAAPGRVRATPFDGSTVRVDWLDKTRGEAGFAVQVSDDGGKTWRDGAAAGRNATVANVGGLKADKVYTFRVAALGGPVATLSPEPAAPAAMSAPSNPDDEYGPGLYRISISKNNGEKKYKVDTDLTASDEWVRAASWQSALGSAVGGSAYVEDTDSTYYFADAGAFRAGYAADVQAYSDTPGTPSDLPTTAGVKIIAFEDSYGSIDSDFDDVYWTVGVEYKPDVSIAASDASASEVGPDTGEFIITRAGGTDDELTVTYVAGGTADAGTDYESLTGSVKFLPGSSTAKIVVTPKGDMKLEETESVDVSLTAMENSPYALANEITPPVPPSGSDPNQQDPTTKPATSQPATTQIADPKVR